jgi:hypothetical protein
MRKPFGVRPRFEPPAASTTGLLRPAFVFLGSRFGLLAPREIVGL